EGVPAPGATILTVAVKVTAWPPTEGLGEEVSVVVVAALLTTWRRTIDALPANRLSPAYTAVREWMPTASVEVVRVAVALVFKVMAPRVTAPSLNSTEPVGGGTPAIPVTVAVRVTSWPKTEGFGLETRVVVVAGFTSSTLT